MRAAPQQRHCHASQRIAAAPETRWRRGLKQESQHGPLADRELEALQWSKAGAAAAAAPSKAERRAEAKAKGYEGEMCGECGHFSLAEKWHLHECDTCGSTTGCS